MSHFLLRYLKNYLIFPRKLTVPELPGGSQQILQIPGGTLFFSRNRPVILRACPICLDYDSIELYFLQKNVTEAENTKKNHALRRLTRLKSSYPVENYLSTRKY